MKNMRTDEILTNISGNGGFENWMHWTRKECKEWVKANYPCSDYVAEKVAQLIVCGW